MEINHNITHCKGEGCARRGHCLRYLAHREYMADAVLAATVSVTYCDGGECVRRGYGLYAEAGGQSGGEEGGAVASGVQLALFAVEPLRPEIKVARKVKSRIHLASGCHYDTIARALRFRTHTALARQIRAWALNEGGTINYVNNN